MAARRELIRQAYAASAEGDFGPLEALFAARASWVGVPSGEEEEHSICTGRDAIVARFREHHANGRRFELGETIEQGDCVAVAVTIHDPKWSGPVAVWKVFAFQPTADTVARMNDCIDESSARQILAP